MIEENLQNPLNEQELLPDPARTVNGLRDTGYDFNTAIADIIDNSISARATRINVVVTILPNREKRVFICDNGEGMDHNALVNAMKYGSEERKEKHSLGKFGMGLKTASTAFCRQLSVISRNSKDEKFEKVQWDLDYIADQGKWLLRFLEINDEEKEQLDALVSESSGTLVAWTKIDRMLKNYKNPANENKALDKMLKELKFHLSMVFQKFMEPTSEHPITITVNDEVIKPWDPFCTKEKNTELLQHVDVPVDIAGKEVHFKLNAYVLPRVHTFSSTEAERDARVSNDMQGIYVYRENRLIHYGDWLGIAKKEPHFSLSRVEFSFGAEMDELLSVDIKKSRILLIGELYQYLDNFLNAPRREAQKRYRDKEIENLDKNSDNAHDSSNENIDSKADDLEESKITQTGDNEVSITNQYGTTTATIKIETAVDPKKNRVHIVPNIEGNALWEPAIIDGKHAVNINESHPYYSKIYGPYLTHNTIVEGLDCLLWALAEAENSTCNEHTKENYEDMRFQVSRILKKLVADLPDPEFDDPEEKDDTD